MAGRASWTTVRVRDGRVPGLGLEMGPDKDSRAKIRVENNRFGAGRTPKLGLGLELVRLPRLGLRSGAVRFRTRV